MCRSGKSDMAAIYYESIDVEGHHYGPDSQQIRAAVQQLDKAMQTLHSKLTVSGMDPDVNVSDTSVLESVSICLMLLQEKNMVNQVNIVMFSDHGMMNIEWTRKVIELEKYINMSDIAKMMDRGPVVSLWPKVNKQQQVRLFHQPMKPKSVGADDVKTLSRYVGQELGDR